MPTPEDIEGHRQAVLGQWVDSPRRTWLGLHAEYAAVQALNGRVTRTETGEEFRLTMQRMSPLVRQLAFFGEELPPSTRHPFVGSNRAQRRAARAMRRQG